MEAPLSQAVQLLPKNRQTTKYTKYTKSAGKYHVRLTGSGLCGKIRGDVWAGRFGHAVAEIEAGLGGLVVADVLPGDAKAILRIVHQGVEAMLRGNGRGVDAQFFVVGGAPYHFLAPIAEDVRAEDGSGFGAVVGSAIFGHEEACF